MQFPPELEERLKNEARRLGVSEQECARNILDRLLPSCDEFERRARAIDMLRSWLEESDEKKDEEAGKWLRDALDEERSSEDKLFPPEMKDVTW